MPRLKLSDRAIERLPADGRQTLYWDTAMPGFGVLVSSTTRSFVCKAGGIRKALGRVGVMTLDEAREAARAMLRDLTAGIDPRQEKAAGLTLGEAFARYLKAHDLSPRTKSGYAATLQRYFADWSPRALKDITREMVEARHRTIAEEVEARHTRLAAEPRAAPQTGEAGGEGMAEGSARAPRQGGGGQGARSLFGQGQRQRGDANLTGDLELRRRPGSRAAAQSGAAEATVAQGGGA